MACADIAGTEHCVRRVRNSLHHSWPVSRRDAVRGQELHKQYKTLDDSTTALNGRCILCLFLRGRVQEFTVFSGCGGSGSPSSAYGSVCANHTEVRGFWYFLTKCAQITELCDSSEHSTKADFQDILRPHPQVVSNAMEHAKLPSRCQNRRQLRCRRSISFYRSACVRAEVPYKRDPSSVVGSFYSWGPITRNYLVRMSRTLQGDPNSTKLCTARERSHQR